MSHAKEIGEAIESGDVAKVKEITKLKDFKVDDHGGDYYKATPLMKAITFATKNKEAGIEILKIILAAGALEKNSTTWQGMWIILFYSFSFLIP